MLIRVLEKNPHICVETGMLFATLISRKSPRWSEFGEDPRFCNCEMAWQSPSAASCSEVGDAHNALKAFPPLIFQPFTAQKSVHERFYLSPDMGEVHLKETHQIVEMFCWKTHISTSWWSWGRYSSSSSHKSWLNWPWQDNQLRYGANGDQPNQSWCLLFSVVALSAAALMARGEVNNTDRVTMKCSTGNFDSWYSCKCTTPPTSTFKH